MMLVRVVFVCGPLPKLAELDGVDRLVIVHRAPVKGREPQPQGDGESEQQADCDVTVHLQKPKAISFKFQASSIREVPNFKLQCTPAPIGASVNLLALTSDLRLGNCPALRDEV